MNKKNWKKHERQSAIWDTCRQLEPYLGLGLTFTVYILAFLFMGYWLDKKIGTEPWLMVIGAALGLTLGFVRMISTLNRLSQQQSRNNSRDEDSGS